MNWPLLFMGIAVAMILEGLMPALVPRTWRHLLGSVQQMTDAQVRALGLASLVAGVLLLRWLL